mgnify:CR=1 FL=1
MDNLFKDIFEDLFPDLSKKTTLQKEGDAAFELSYWLKKLNTHGEEIILSEKTKIGENIIIYRHSIEEDNSVISLLSCIFSNEGVNSFTPSLSLIYKKMYEIMEIADIRMNDKDANKGYGSSLMKAMFLAIERYPLPYKYITGWISGVDWHHVERNQHFYEKFGFSVDLNHDIDEGTILWINPLNSGTLEHYRSLNYKPGFEGLIKEIDDEERQKNNK